MEREQPSDLAALLQNKPQPAEGRQNRPEGGLLIAGLVGVVDPQDELPAAMPGPEPVEEGRAHAPDVHVTGGAGGETGADDRHGQLASFQAELTRFPAEER